MDGYILSDGEFSTGILAVAVPVMDTTSGHYEYSLNASLPRINWNADDYALQIVANLQLLAKKLEGYPILNLNMGYSVVHVKHRVI